MIRVKTEKSRKCSEKNIVPSLSAPAPNTTGSTPEHSTQYSTGSTARGNMARQSKVPAQERECPAILQQVLNISNLTDIQSESCDITRAEQINLDRSRDTPVPLLSTQTDNLTTQPWLLRRMVHSMITNLNIYFPRSGLC